MLTDYINAVLRRARYDILAEGEGFYGEIDGLPGVWASDPVLERCREQLRAAVEDWLLVKLRHNDGDLPVVEGLDLNAHHDADREQEVA